VFLVFALSTSAHALYIGLDVYSATANPNYSSGACDDGVNTRYQHTDYFYAESGTPQCIVVTETGFASVKVTTEGAISTTTVEAFAAADCSGTAVLTLNETGGCTDITSHDIKINPTITATYEDLPVGYHRMKQVGPSTTNTSCSALDFFKEAVISVWPQDTCIYEELADIQATNSEPYVKLKRADEQLNHDAGELKVKTTCYDYPCYTNTQSLGSYSMTSQTFDKSGDAACVLHNEGAANQYALQALWGPDASVLSTSTPSPTSSTSSSKDDSTLIIIVIAIVAVVLVILGVGVASTMSKGKAPLSSQGESFKELEEPGNAVTPVP
jgi:hypothetical protein